jgi:hypothetical protein
MPGNYAEIEIDLTPHIKEAVVAERERIATQLMAEAENSPCREDASVLRSAAWLVRANFSYDEAERLEVAAEKSE